jgi:hypothetical protein
MQLFEMENELDGIVASYVVYGQLHFRWLINFENSQVVQYYWRDMLRGKKSSRSSSKSKHAGQVRKGYIDGH